MAPYIFLSNWIFYYLYCFRFVYIIYRKSLLQIQYIIRQIGAILIILFGLIVLGILRLPFLEKDKKISFKQRPSGYVGSVVIGMGFAAGGHRLPVLFLRLLLL